MTIMGKPAEQFAPMQSWLEMIKFSHSIFALPFALGAMWIAAEGWPGTTTFLLIVAAMITARTCAMACNRWADLRIDALNPRTQSRPSIDGRVSKRNIIATTLLSGLCFIAICAALNPLALILSPVALLVLCGYSFTKRFTNWPHLFVGLALGIAPLAAEVAVSASISTPFLVLSAAVALWVAGFDMLYALLDLDFDRANGIHSLPARYGIRTTLWISRLTHSGAAAGFIAFGFMAALGTAYFWAVGAICLALVIEQSLLRADDLSRMNAAFFTANGWVSMLFLLGTLAG